ncbi:OmpA family protein [Spongiibacter sp. KMU-158]|uniref:OmpA family protein n=1 Tax=Spongiibacter pelagi TaxID=2760804 RepID=A0A927BZW1_9GAMM|nr:OmpA family protein [Spongiibacter pelagi]MBD2857467.1 OmpA family protein [Spongiibacter pelagi]
MFLKKRLWHRIASVVFVGLTLSPAVQAEGGLLEQLGQRLGLWALLDPLAQSTNLDVRALVVALDSGLQTQPLADLLLPQDSALGMSDTQLGDLLSMDEPAATALFTPSAAANPVNGSGDQPALSAPSLPEAEYKGGSPQVKLACRDEDRDGVCDGEDQCAYTPAQSQVMANGCVLAGADALFETAIFFQLDRSDIQPADHPQLDRLAGMMLARASRKLEIHGYADATGNARHNIALSEARADAVIDYLVSRGVPPQRLSAKGYGDTLVAAAGEQASERRVTLRMLTD